MKKLILLLFITIQHFAFAAKYLRYNLIGYEPKDPKIAIIMSDEDCSTLNWALLDTQANTLVSGQLGNNLSGKGEYMPKNFNYKIDFSSVQDSGIFFLKVDQIGTYKIRIACNPYQHYIPDILRAIRVRRSGSPDALDHAISHLGDSACPVFYRNGGDNKNWTLQPGIGKVDMAGGFYDAGDYIKFTLTNAYLTYFLLRSYQTNTPYFDQFKGNSTTSLGEMLDQCKWGLDYLLKTMPDNSTEFIIQVGGHLDHEQWPLRLPENDALDGKRECYSAKSKTQMGLTVAALALGSSVFESKGMLAEAAKYKTKAEQIYQAAKASTEPDAWWAGANEVYYADNSSADNMELAATELYILTQKQEYLTDAKGYADLAAAGYWSAWSNVNLTAHDRIFPFYPQAEQYLTVDLDNFLDIASRPNNVWKLPHESVWGSLYNQFCVAHGASEFKNRSGMEGYKSLTKNVIDYTFGLNPWGLCFIASEGSSSSIKSSYATIYKLQPGKFPYGEIAEGPAPKSDHDSNVPYFSPAHNAGLWHKEFNTSAFTFFEEPGNYVCMETTISGLADGLFLLSQASNKNCKEVLSVKNDLSVENAELKVYPNPGIEGDTFTLLTRNKDVSRISVTDLQGNILKSWSRPGSFKLPFIAKGVYFISVDFKDKTSAKTRLVVN